MSFIISLWDETFGKSFNFDLDDEEDKNRFIGLYGLDFYYRVIYLYPGEIIRVKCLERVDEE